MAHAPANVIYEQLMLKRNKSNQKELCIKQTSAICSCSMHVTLFHQKSSCDSYVIQV